MWLSSILTALVRDLDGELAEAFERVAEALRNQYAIAYTSDDQRKDGSWRETRLTALKKGLSVTARRVGSLSRSTSS